MVNAPMNNVNQAQAVIAAESMSFTTLGPELDRTDGKKDIKKTDWMEKLIESGGSKEVSTSILQNMMSKMAEAGIPTFTRSETRVENKKSENKKEDLTTSSDEHTDSVKLSSKGDDLIPVKGMGKGKEQNYEQASKEKIEIKWETIKKELIEQGKSNEEISQRELQFKQSEMKNYLFNMLKDSAIMYYLDSDSKISESIRLKGFSKYMQKAGKEFSKEAVKEAQAELRSFSLHELEKDLVLRTFLQDKDYKNTYKLIDLGKKMGADPLNWMEKIWPDKKENYGLNILDIPHEVAFYVDVKDNNANSDARKDRAKYDYKVEDEKDILLNRLRACYLQMALQPEGSKRSPLTWFKIESLKSGLKRLKIYTKEMDKAVNEEAKTLARIKSTEMLDEALHEQASLIDPEKDPTVKGKIKNCLKNLERLGMKLSDTEFVALRDKANKDMYNMVELEIENTKKETGPAAEKKLQQLNKLLARLRSESSSKEQV
jgi:hypothetical protein